MAFWKDVQGIILGQKYTADNKSLEQVISQKFTEYIRIEEKVVYCKPTEFQLSVYKSILESEEAQLILTQNDPCDCGSNGKKGKCCYKETSDGKTLKSLTFSYMHLLLKASNHIALLLPDKTGSETQKKLSEKVCMMAFAKHPQFVQQTKQSSFRTLSDPKYCGKMKVLHGLLSVFRKERCKVLLFSYSTMILDILEQYLISKGYEYRRLDGKTPDFKRQSLVREFNKDPNLFIFLASTKAGGIGLNLTGANVVVIFDPTWNPTHDLQAQDRAYRIGQGRDVRVLRLICSGTIEENIYLRQVYKQQLDNVAVGEENAKRYFHGIQGDKNCKGELFGIENMFKLTTGDRCLTEDILQRNSVIETSLKGFVIEDYIAAPVKQPKSEDPEIPMSDKSEQEDMESDSHALDYLFDEVHSPAGKPTAKHKRKSKTKMEKKYELSLSSEDSCEEEMLPKPTVLSQKGRHYSDKDDLIECKKSQTTTKNTCKCEQCLYPKASTSDMGSSKGKKGKRKIGRPPTKVQTNTRISYNKSDDDSSTDEQFKEPSKKISKKGKGQGKKSKDSPITTEKTKPKEVHWEVPQTLASFDSISDVLKNCGVVHTHENRKVIGGSKAEDHMSRKAIEDVYELHQYSQAPAMQCDPYQESSSSGEESDDLGVKNIIPDKKVGIKTTATPTKSTKDSLPAVCVSKEKPRVEMIDNKKVLICQTPKAIRKQHFRNMAKSLDMTDIEFARKVIFETPEGRKELLKTFYSKQDIKLESIFDEESSKSDPKGKSHSAKKVTKSVPKRRSIVGKCKKQCISKGLKYEEDSQSDDCPQETQRKRSHRKVTRTFERKSNFKEKNEDESVNDEKEKNEQLESKIPEQTVDFWDELIQEQTNANEVDAKMTKVKDENQSMRSHTGGDQENLKKSKVIKQEKYQPTDMNETLGFLDNLFFDDIKKKSPPKRKVPTRSKIDMNKDPESAKEFLDFIQCDTLESGSEPLSQDCVDKESLSAMFNDPKKWTKRKKSPRVSDTQLNTLPVEELDAVLEKDSKDYQNLFTSSKMKRK